MWVSIQDNRRKKGKDNSVDKIQQYLKLTEKSSFSTSLLKTSVSPSALLVSNTKENDSTPFTSYRSKFKSKNTTSANSLAPRNPLACSQINGNTSMEILKKPGSKIVKETYSVSYKVKSEEEACEIKTKKVGYFLECLSKKNKLKSQLTINIHNSIFTFKEYMKASLSAPPKQPNPKLTPETPGRKTIIFDMDETLIHTNETPTKNYEIKVPFRYFQGKVGYGYVEVRPYAKEILKNLSQHFDIFIFTASTQAYADPIIDHLDPDRVVQHRLYRESCSLVRNQVFVKDLRVLGRKLQNVLLVDNAPYSYMMQLANGVPCISYYRGKEDDQLVALQEYLMGMKDVQDVRKPNSEFFKLHEYVRFDSHERLVSKLYPDWIK